MKYTYRLKNLENGYIWGNYTSADDAFDAIEHELAGVTQSHIMVIRVRVD